MKKLLFLFLVLLGCSEGPEVPSIVLMDKANARIANATCEGKDWDNDVLDETYTFGSVAADHIYTTSDGVWRVSPYQVTLTFQNLSTTTSVKIKVPANSFGSETLSPGETYTPSSPMFSMTCICDTNCPFAVGHDFDFKVTNLFGNQTAVDIRVGYIINSPHHWGGGAQIAYDVTHWQP